MQEIPINKIKTNSGQIPDVPANPRTITKDKFELLKKSITEDPEFLKLNPILLYDIAEHLLSNGKSLNINNVNAIVEVSFNKKGERWIIQKTKS